MIHACATSGCGTLTMGQFCLTCELERGVEFPRFTRRAARRRADEAHEHAAGESAVPASVGDV